MNCLLYRLLTDHIIENDAHYLYAGRWRSLPEV